MYGALTDIVRRVGRDKFPLVDINYYSSASQMVVHILNGSICLLLGRAEV
jgi:hypothetical protein